MTEQSGVGDGAFGDGAWGLRFPSLNAAAHMLVDAPQWPVVSLDVRLLAGPVRDDSSVWNAWGMRLALAAGGLVEVVWPFEVTLSLPGQPVAECVLQPHLSSAAAAISLRRGFQPFHAGAFEVDGRAWGLVGSKEIGKSSTLALASEQGSAIVADDLLVIDGGVALAGPRGIDLRREPARFLEMGEDLGVVGLRERWRVRVGPCPPATPMAGFVVPSWGDSDVSVLPPVARLQMLFSNSALLGVTMNDPGEYLRLTSLPMISWVRPKSWSTARQSFDRLLGKLASLPGGKG